MADYQFCKVDREGPLTIVTLNRPEVMNALHSDAHMELAEVFDNFANLTEDRMAILISYRFSTVRMADRIVVLKGGVIEETGTHAELIAAGGQYARLFELQAANYR